VKGEREGKRETGREKKVSSIGFGGWQPLGMG